MNIGLVEMDLGRLDDALVSYDHAVRVYIRIRHPFMQALALTNLGDVLERPLRFDDSAAAFRLAARIYHDRGDRPRRAGR